MLTSKEQIKALLGGTFDASADALLDTLASAASAFVVGKLGWNPEKSVTNDVLDGMGGSAIVLTRPIVTDFTDLTINGNVIPVAPDTVSNGYVVNREVGIVYLRGYCAWKGMQNIAATYEAGYDPIPGDLAMAATELASLRWKVRSNIGIQSRTLANETITFTDKDMTGFTKSVIALYDRPITA
jgi:hypothetical protein